MNAHRFGLARLRAAWLSLALGAAVAAAGCATMSQRPDTIVLPASSPFPEALAASADGTLYVSSLTHGGILKVPPGSSTAVPFVRPGEHGTRSTFGVLPDEKRGILWVGSNDATVFGIQGPTTTEGGWIKGFDLKTGAPKVSVRLPGTPAIAQDFALAEDGTLYVTNTAAPQILRLKPGASEVEVFVQDEALKGALDGIAFGRDGNLYVNTYLAGELFRIDVRDGKAGKVTKLRTSRPLTKPDGLRPFKDGLLMVEGGGEVTRVTVDGDSARIETIGQAAEPTSLWLTADRVWVSEGQLSYLAPEKKGQLPDSFKLRALPLPRN